MKDSNLKQIFTSKPENVLGTKEDPRQILPPNQELGKQVEERRTESPSDDHVSVKYANPYTSNRI